MRFQQSQKERRDRYRLPSRQRHLLLVYPVGNMISLEGHKQPVPGGTGQAGKPGSEVFRGAIDSDGPAVIVQTRLSAFRRSRVWALVTYRVDGIASCRSEIVAGLSGVGRDAPALQNSAANHPIEFEFHAGNRPHVDLPPDQSSSRCILFSDRDTTKNRFIHLCL